ncbi:hypothetical protein Tco_1042240 [Tanacetum coccineum]|uniref:Uncharacterized protein n=1 Tax=Tanacetum coccineum TaxID=301880 RepID=A0ABQ5GIJ1_9ASTR
MDDPNITMEEYIRLEEEKARRQGRTFNWQTARYRKMEYYENENDSFTDLEIEYPAIVFDDTSDVALSREPMVSPLDNNEIDFNISFDESDDEDYMVVFDENSFSCKIISVDNLKTDSENKNDKVNIPSSPSPEPTIGYFNDLDFFKDFENEFPAIVYNDLNSKSDPLNEPSVSSKHIDNFETSLSEYDEKEQNVLCLDDSFPLNIRHIDMAPLPHRDLRHPWLRYQVDGYDEGIVHNGMRQTLRDRLSMVYAGDDGQALFTSHVMSDAEMGLDVADTLCFQLGGARRRMTWRQFILALGLHSEEEMGAEKVTEVDLFYLRTIDREIANVPYLIAQYLFRFAKGRKSGARLSEGSTSARDSTIHVVAGAPRAAKDAPAANEGA